MPSKPPFDPKFHLIDGQPVGSAGQGGMSGSTDDDEALARMLQEQILEEERSLHRESGGVRAPSAATTTAPAPRTTNHTNHTSIGNSRRSGGGGGNNPSRASASEMEDMELVMLMQRQEMEALQRGGPLDDMELARRMQQEEAMNQANYGYHSQLDYARRIQEQALRNVRPSSTPPVPSGGYGGSGGGANSIGGFGARRVLSSGGNSTSSANSHDSDLELARRMQELEQMGMGRLNSQRGGLSAENPTSPSNSSNENHNNSNNYQRNQSSEAAADERQRQEAEDARLARMIAESGGSLRYLQPQTPAPLPQQPPPTPAPAPTPSPRQAPLRPLQAHTLPQQSPPERPSVPRLQQQRPPQQRPPPQRPQQQRPPPQRPQQQRPPQPQSQPPTPQEGRNSSGDQQQQTEQAKNKRRGPFNREIKPTKPSIPAPIPPASQRTPRGPLPYSSVGSQNMSVPLAPNATTMQRKRNMMARRKNESICSSCKKPATSFLVALDKKYHPECFKCAGCHNIIDSNGPFAYTTDGKGEKHPLHRKCYAELYGVKCAVCKKSIPAGPDGKVSFVKHPFFDSEQMCPRHARNPGRRCTGCHRFEPESEPFADLNDSGRCVCYACCRSVVVDSDDAQPLWDKVVAFLEHKLHLPIWKDLRKVPILIVGYEALNDQMRSTGAVHGGSSQIMTRGLCLTEHQSGRKVKLASMKYNEGSMSFVACDVEARGFSFFQVPDANKVNPDASVTAILCLSGLPRDLAASVLAHEAIHAWIKLHPRFDISYPIPPQVEEGCAQLVAMLFLTDGLDPPSTDTYGDTGPSDEKLRQYFKFSIETDDHEIYGEGYRKAATAYANIGIEALLSHVVLYQNFPKT